MLANSGFVAGALATEVLTPTATAVVAARARAPETAKRRRMSTPFPLLPAGPSRSRDPGTQRPPDRFGSMRNFPRRGSAQAQATPSVPAAASAPATPSGSGQERPHAAGRALARDHAADEAHQGRGSHHERDRGPEQDERPAGAGAEQVRRRADQGPRRGPGRDVGAEAERDGGEHQRQPGHGGGAARPGVGKLDGDRVHGASLRPSARPTPPDRREAARHLHSLACPRCASTATSPRPAWPRAARPTPWSPPAASRSTASGVADLGRRVGPGQRVEVDGKLVGRAERLVHLMLHKPPDVVTTLSDPQGRRTVADLIEADVRVYPVGRLDADTTGLLLLTNEGDLAHGLSHPSSEVEKVYRATVRGRPSETALQQLRTGVELEDGPTAPARVRCCAPATGPARSRWRSTRAATGRCGACSTRSAIACSRCTARTTGRSRSVSCRAAPPGRSGRPRCARSGVLRACERALRILRARHGPQREQRRARADGADAIDGLAGGRRPHRGTDPGVRRRRARRHRRRGHRDRRHRPAGADRRAALRGPARRRPRRAAAQGLQVGVARVPRPRARSSRSAGASSARSTSRSWPARAPSRATSRRSRRPRTSRRPAARCLRGGAFKPRTSPYAFQGLGVRGLEILHEVGRETGLPIATELMDARDLDAVQEHVDLIWIGARNMQNFNLLVGARPHATSR